ncbi:MAG: hypothetical protein MUQ10_10570 [Anaerolineae bacterium]|nr:hypothetical protein [Anaerolineae bacterium]
MYKLSRREFLHVGSLAAAGAVLAACAPQTPAPTQEPAADATEATDVPEAAEATEAPEAEPTDVPAEAEGTLIRYWAGWGGAGFLAAWETIQQSDGFKEALGNNTFEMKDAIEGEAMLTAIAGGDPPEGGGNIQYMDFMARDVLLPIDDLVAASSIVKEDVFIPGNWSLCFYNGAMYGVPAIEGFLRFALNYNTRLVEEAGLDPDSPPETWDETYDWHVALTKFDAAGNAQQIGLNPYGAMGEGFWYSDGWMVPTSWGWQWFDEESKTFDLNNEKLVDAFATQKRFIDYVGVDNLAAMYSVEGRDTWGGAFNAEVESMIIEGYWHPGETANEKPEVAEFNRATWLPVPEIRRGVKPQGAAGHMVVFFKGSENPEGMFRISEFLQSALACDAFWHNLGWLPSVLAYYDSVDPNEYPGLEFYFQSAQEATEWYYPARCEITDFASTEYLNIKDLVNRDEMTPEQAAEEMQQRCEAEYEAAGFAS